MWKVEGIGLREAGGLLHVMARECGGDPAATDATRVLRLPGFANKNYETDFFVEVRKEVQGTASIQIRIAFPSCIGGLSR